MRSHLSLTLLLLPFLSSTSANHSPNQNSRLRHKRAANNQHANNNFQIVEREATGTETGISLLNGTSLEKRGDTYYGTGTYFFVGLGACGQYSQDSDYMVALNYQLYGGGYPGPQCFKQITIQANGVTVGGVTIMDECPSCPNVGDLDLSPGLFQRFAGTEAGTIQMTWWFNDGSQQTTTSVTPTSTWVAPTSTWTPPPPSTQAYTPPSTTQTSTWSPSPSPITWIQPTSTSAVASSSASSITSSTATSSAPSSTITSSTWSNGTTVSRSANPYAVISSYEASQSGGAAPSASASVTGEASASASGISGGGVAVLGEGNLVALNGLVANYGNLIVQGAQVGQ